MVNDGAAGTALLDHSTLLEYSSKGTLPYKYSDMRLASGKLAPPVAQLSSA